MHYRLGGAGCAAALAAVLIAPLGACAGRPAPAAPPSPAPQALAPRAARVRPGIEVLLDDSAGLVRGRRVGLVTNQTGVDRQGVSDVERLRSAGVTLVALFSPEHGFRGAADPGAAVASTTDSATGLPIYSLYGRASAPTDTMLAGLDLLLVDLQDAGARYYTYLATTLAVMRAAAARGIPVAVLDRPNPIGGAVEGDVLDSAYRTAVGAAAIPMRHGLTLAELARLAAAERGLPAPGVVPAAGWHRGTYFDETGLPFVPPSPNLRSMESLIHYPGLCLIEGTNLSVGRGSEHPFEQIGAPWLDAVALRKALARAELTGVAFDTVSFTPRLPGDGKYADTLVHGLRLRVTDRATYRPVRTALVLLDAVVAQQGVRDTVPAAGRPFRFLLPQLRRLWGRPDLADRIAHGFAAAMDGPEWREGLQAFAERRRAYLIYPE